MTLSSAGLLKLALTLVPSHGFTREALAHSVLKLPEPRAHSKPLSDTAVSALFGCGTLAQRTLINAWLNDGILHIRALPKGKTMKEVLRARLQFNDPVLHYLPEAFGLLAAPSYRVPIVDFRPALLHAFKIADEVCYAAGDTSAELAWYLQRTSVAAIYTAAELHQLTSPHTALDFLDSLLDGSSSIKTGLEELNLYTSYVFKSWGGILRSFDKM